MSTDAPADDRPGLVPDVPVALGKLVRRVLCDNPGMMTGPGTNTYLIGQDEIAVIDPGPDDAAHLDAVAAAGSGRIRWILCTHTHGDHSPGAAGLKERTGAEVLAFADRDGLVCDRHLVDGDIVEGTEFTLRAVHTPGHASNHLCYRLEEEKTLFTGDHVMQLSTVVINPPDGDMAAYLASLRALCGEDLDWLAPGHGFLMAQPRAAFEKIIAHRLQREAKVLAAIRELASTDEAVLLSRVYDDVPERMHPMALRSLRAHLSKLRSEGRA